MHQQSAFRRVWWSVLLPACLLLVVGWLGIARAEELTGGSGQRLWRQLAWSAVSGLVVVAAIAPHYRALRGLSYPLVAMSLGLLVAVYFFPPVNGARRWIRFGPLGFQPSELAKIALVLGLANYLATGEAHRRLRGLLVPLCLVIPPLLLILKEPDLGTALVLLPVVGAVLLAAGARAGHLAWGVAFGFALIPLLWTQMSREQKSRVTALWDQSTPWEQPSDDAFHLHQAKQMLALGSWRGSFWDDDAPPDRSVLRVPEPHTDSIISVIIERYGLLGLACVLTLFCVLVSRMLAVGLATREPFGRLLAIGMASLIGVQVVINVGMMVGLLPITGLALPLVSYGGSSLSATWPGSQGIQETSG